MTDAIFAGSIPKFYETHLVPLIFEPYAPDLARRLASNAAGRVLELAAGTGVATRALASILPATSSIVATDLNVPMLEQAKAIDIARPVEWRQADAMQLPFENGAFDAVVCQFGVMFFPDKPLAFSEARRVLAEGGVFVFNVWDRIEENEFADMVTTALTRRYPDDPPRFLARVPHGLLRPSSDRKGPRRRRLRAAASDRHRCGTQPCLVCARAGDGVLPGHTAQKRNRGARSVRARGGD